MDAIYFGFNSNENSKQAVKKLIKMISKKFCNALVFIV